MYPSSTSSSSRASFPRIVARPSVSLAMQVPQLPASHENGGDRPARRALSRRVSPATRGTDTFLRSSTIVTCPLPSPAGEVGSGSAVITLLLAHRFWELENTILVKGYPI